MANYVTVTLDLKDGSGNLITQGYATFVPSVQLSGAGLVNQAPIAATFRNTGSSPTVSLLATDNAGITPSGWVWNVVFTDIPGNLANFSFFLPFANGASQNLSSLVQTPAVTPTQAYLPLPSGAPQANQVPVATGVGEASAWGTPPGGVPSGAAGGDLAGNYPNPTVAKINGTAFALPVSIANGGTGAATQQAAINALTGAQSAGKVLRSDGTNAALSSIQAADVPTLNQNTTGTAANVTGTVAIANGGTGQITQQAALDALAGAVTAGLLLRGNGTHVTLAALQASDVPTLNQNTTGTAANVTGTVAIANGGTGQVSAAAAYNALSPMSTLGDIEYESAANTAARLAGNTSATKNFLTQTGTGSVSAAPAWGTIAAGDLPAATTSAQGAVQLDNTASDIKPTSTTSATGSSVKVPSADHVHAQNYGGMFGDGSDGALTFDGTTTVIGIAPSSNTYTLNRDVFATSLTINGGVTVAPNGYRIFCAGTFTNNGTVSSTGPAASGATGGVATAAGTLNSGTSGTNGGTGVGGVAPASNPTVGVGAGGAGGNGSPNSGGAGRAPRVASSSQWRLPATALAGLMIAAFTGSTAAPVGGLGGSAGGGDGTNSGGGGGAGGGLVVIFAWSAINGATGSITVQGGAGGNAVAGNCGGGGGGGGGNIVVYTLSAWTNNGSTNVTGGAGGTLTGTGTNGSAGGSGSLLNVLVR